ncbi:MAG: hypothetical protein KGK16_14830 [Bradyrhizobium sp.]|uniref:hypothetical protein n=1 Tax=Bradyrhizobium sp. TaxID=376 RepID=UPI0023A5B7A2|nr:hypothetical protein [Bradyrhizobium sp.]MDE2332040.1 hypothetical protein [Bradyrhizobium sp.]MDE2602685.1 hypothetical protein [Bradyrhizobium sp.]
MPDVDLGALVHALINIIKSQASRVHLSKYRRRKPGTSHAVTIEPASSLLVSKACLDPDITISKAGASQEAQRDDGQFTVIGLPMKRRERTDSHGRRIRSTIRIAAIDI